MAPGSRLTSNHFLNKLYLNNWYLFWLVAVSMTVAVFLAMTGTDLSDPAGVASMITFSVRLAVPWLYLAFAASSLYMVFPGNVTRWLRRNRRMVGLSFAAGMGWQLVFIIWLVGGHFDYYMEEAYSYYSLAEQVPGYLVLIAMTLTSFKPGRRMLTGRQWNLLHTGGIYFLWAVLFSTYWYELFYYDDIQVIDRVYYWLGFAAWAIRVVAWTRARLPEAVAETS